MYRLSQVVASQRTADTRQEQPPTTRARKRDRPVGKVCNRHGGKSIGHNTLGGQWPVQDPKTPLQSERRFVRFQGISEPSPIPAVGFTRIVPYAGYSNVHLPVEALRCSIGVAYQAADAGHPVSGRASSPPSKEPSPASSIFPNCTRRKLI